MWFNRFKLFEIQGSWNSLQLTNLWGLKRTNHFQEAFHCAREENMSWY